MAAVRRILTFTARRARGKPAPLIQIDWESYSSDTEDRSLARVPVPVGRPPTPPFCEVPHPAAKRSIHEALAGTSAEEWTPQAIAALQKRQPANSNILNLHPRDKRVYTDFGNGRHAYMVDNIERKHVDGWYSGSSINHLLWMPFDSAGISRRLGTNAAAKQAATAATLAGIPDNVVTPPTAEAVEAAQQEYLADWDNARESGTSKHAAADAFCQGDPHPVGELPLPVGFYRAMEQIHAMNLVIYRTEWSIFDEDLCLMGQADIVCRHKETGEYHRDEDLEAPTKSKKYGVHPFTCNMQDTKYNHYRIQLSVYRAILARKYGLKMAPKMLLFNFRPATPEAFQMVTYEPLDLEPLFALMPWRAADPRHTLFPGPTLVARLTTPAASSTMGPPVDRRPNRASRVCVRGMRSPLPADIVWTGRMFPGKMARAQTMKEVKRRVALGEDTSDLLPWLQLEDSQWQHPWYIPKDMHLVGACGFYERHLLQSRDLLRALPTLQGKKLACWCAADATDCHVDVLVKYVNAHAAGAFQLPPEQGLGEWDESLPRPEV